jgi:hypothetical protein
LGGLSYREIIGPEVAPDVFEIVRRQSSSIYTHAEVEDKFNIE